MNFPKLLSGLLLAAAALTAQAETIRIAIGTQDTTINCATGGVLIRELKLLEKFLPRDGKYKDAQYDIQWKNFTSGPPLTNEMVADKLDIGTMADFPGVLNITAFQKAGKKSFFVTVLSGSPQGTGNGIVVPNDSPVRSLADLKGKTISVPFGSTAHGMLLRAIKAQGWDPDKDVNLVSQSPEVGGSALQSKKVDAHANFVPFPELFTFRGFARKVYDGAQADTPTFHGSLVNADFAKKYPELVVAFLRAAIEADRLFAADPEKYSELIAKTAGIEAEVNYLFHGPLGLQTRDNTWKPEYRQAIKTSILTLNLLKRSDAGFDTEAFVDDSFIRTAYKQAGLDYEARLKSYAKQPLSGKDARTGEAIREPKRVAQLWLQGETKVRHYAAPESAFIDLSRLEGEGKKVRVIYVHDRNTGLKLFGDKAWYVRDGKGAINAFLLRDEADAWAKAKGGTVGELADVRRQK